MTEGLDIWAVVPVKRLDQAKQRLAPAYSPAARQALVRSMLEDVLAALAQVDGLRIAVVTSDPAVAAIASRASAIVFTDDADAGYTAATMAAARRLVRDGRSGMMVLPGDVPGVTQAEIRQLLQAHQPGRAVTIVPSRDRTGTNAILLSPPDAIPLAFGPDSFHIHCQTAARAGIEPTVLCPPGIALDLDHPEDVASFLRSTAPTRTRATLTASWAQPHASPLLLGATTP